MEWCSRVWKPSKWCSGVRICHYDLWRPRTRVLRLPLRRCRVLVLILILLWVLIGSRGIESIGSLILRIEFIVASKSRVVSLNTDLSFDHHGHHHSWKPLSPWPLRPPVPLESEEYWFVYTTLVSEYEFKLSFSVECEELAWVRFTVGAKELLEESSLLYFLSLSSCGRIKPSASSVVMCGRWLSMKAIIESKSLGRPSRIESMCSRW